MGMCVREKERESVCVLSECVCEKETCELVGHFLPPLNPFLPTLTPPHLLAPALNSLR
jgi:hypothetical protein